MGIDTIGGIDNPINASVKESELYNVKFGFNEDEHIYDDPNHILDANGHTGTPLPYCTLVRSTEGSQAKINLASATACAGKQRNGGCNEEHYSEPRYTALSQQVQESSLSAPAPPPLPPGYASPKSQIYNECLPELPEYDDCVPRPKDQAPPKSEDCNKPDYGNCLPKLKEQPDYSNCLLEPREQAPPNSEDYHRLLHQAPVKPNLPPGYASPRSLASQAELKEVKSTEEEVTVSSSFKPQDEPGQVKADSGEPKAYIPLRKKSMNQGGAYQDMTTGDIPSSNDGGSQPAEPQLQEEDQYVVMNTPTATVPEPLQ